MPSSALQTASLRDVAAQLCWLTVHGACADRPHPDNADRYGPARPDEVVAELAPGGVVLFGWSGNCEHPAQVAALTAGLQRAAAATGAGLPLGVAIDEEGGRVTRLGPPATVWPSARALARAAEPAAARQRWRAGGAELAEVGVTVNLAPVADVAAVANPVVGERSFGADPQLVGDHAAAAVAGLADAGVAAVAKHLPGHGACVADSHVDLPRVDLDRDELEHVHLTPFRRLLAEQPPAGLMPAHLVATALDAEQPATLSPAILTGLVRDDLGFEGAVVSDSLAMGALAGREPTEVAVAAVAAGVDVLLCPPRPHATVAALVEAVERGRLPEERLQQAARRALALKGHDGPGGEAPAPMSLPAHRQLAADLARNALAVHDPTGRLPVSAPLRVVGARGARALADALRTRGVAAELLERPPRTGLGGLDDGGQARPAGSPTRAGDATATRPDAADGRVVVAVVDGEADPHPPVGDALVVVDVGCGPPRAEWRRQDEDPATVVAFGADATAMAAVADRLVTPA